MDLLRDEFSAFLWDIKQKTGKSLTALGRAFGFIGRDSYTSVKRLMVHKYNPSQQTFFLICELGDKCGISFKESITRFLPLIEPRGRPFNTELILDILTKDTVDYTQYAIRDAKGYIYSIAILGNILSSSLNLLDYWSKKSYNDQSTIAHCKEIACLAKVVKSSTKDMLNLWSCYTANSRLYEIAFKYYVAQVPSKILSEEYGIKKRWISTLVNRAIQEFSYEICAAYNEEK